MIWLSKEAVEIVQTALGRVLLQIKLSRADRLIAFYSIEVSGARTRKLQYHPVIIP